MQSTAGPAAVSVAPASLAAAFAQVPDPRRVASVVYPLAAILATAVAALLANRRSVLAIAEARRSGDGCALGVRAARAPARRAVAIMLPGSTSSSHTMSRESSRIGASATSAT
jgi:hypothetical protein